MTAVAGKRTWATVAILLFVLGACTSGDDGPEAATTTVASTPATTLVSPTTVGLPAAPWAAPKLRSDQVPAVLLQQWRAGGARADCVALAPSDLGAAANGTPRSANFGPDAWAVAWDVPGAPGVQPTGQPCASCGRGTVVVAGTSVREPRPPERSPSASVLPNTKRWADGSSAQWGPMGGTGPGVLTQLWVTGQACLYNVTSYLSQAHLESLLESLRFVEGAP